MDTMVDTTVILTTDTDMDMLVPMDTMVARPLVWILWWILRLSLLRIQIWICSSLWILWSRDPWYGYYGGYYGYPYYGYRYGYARPYGYYGRATPGMDTMVDTTVILTTDTDMDMLVPMDTMV